MICHFQNIDYYISATLLIIQTKQKKWLSFFSNILIKKFQEYLHKTLLDDIPKYTSKKKKEKKKKKTLVQFYRKKN